MSRRGHGGFRRRGALHTWSLHFGPNMTPMVDVVMVILVFFMASAAFLGPEWFLRALLPKPAAGASGHSPPSPPPPPDPMALRPVRQVITLRVGEGGRTVADGLGNTGQTIPEIVAAVAAFAEGAAKDEIEILIRPEGGVPYADVVRVHEGCERAGIGRVGVGVGGGVGSDPASGPGVNRPGTAGE